MSFRASWTWWCKNILHCGQRDMYSWSMVNNEENWLPCQIKDSLNKKNKKSPKGAQSLGLVKFQSPVPKRLKAIQNDRFLGLIGPNRVLSALAFGLTSFGKPGKREWYLIVFHRFFEKFTGTQNDVSLFHGKNLTVYNSWKWGNSLFSCRTNIEMVLGGGPHFWMLLMTIILPPTG